MTSVALPSPGRETEARTRSRVTSGEQELSTKEETGHAGARVRLGVSMGPPGTPACPSPLPS